MSFLSLFSDNTSSAVDKKNNANVTGMLRRWMHDKKHKEKP